MANKKEYIFDYNAWHCRVMKYTWGWDDRDFSHMCPYFWLSIFNMICAFWIAIIFKEGFKWGGKGFGFIFKYLAISLKHLGNSLSNGYDFVSDWISDINEKRETKRRVFEALVKEQEKQRLRELMERIRTNGVNKYIEEAGGKVDEKVQNFFLHNDFDLWHKMIDGVNQFNYRAEQSREQRLKDRAAKLASIKTSLIGITDPMNKEVKNKTWKEEQAEKEKQRVIRNKAHITKLYLIIQPILKWTGYILGGAIVLTALYFIILFIPILFGWIVAAFKAIIWFFKWVGEGFASVEHNTWMWWIYTILFVILVFAMILGIMFLSDYIRKNNIKIRIKILHIFPKRVKKYISYQDRWTTKFKKWWAVCIGNPIIFVFKAIGRFFAFIGKIIWIGLCGIAYGISSAIKWLKSAFRLCIQMIKNECPPIVWKGRPKN